MTLIFKVCGRQEWRAAALADAYAGSPDDARDGFIHFSTASQLPGTLVKHYAGRDDLLLIAVDGDALGATLKWEASRGGDLFPHLYGALPLSAVLWTKELPFDGSGHHHLPAEAGQ